MSQLDIRALGATQIVVGTSAIVQVSPSRYQATETFKIFAGGGTLEIVTEPAALSGASAIGWGLGYPVGASEIVSVKGAAVFYLAASGATMTAAMIVGRTSGATTT